MKFSAVTLALTGAVGVLVGTLITDHGPRVASAHPAPPPAPQAPAPPPNDGKLRIIVFGAHPDDAEYRGAGVAMKWAKAGHHVKLVSVTNGDIGHWEQAGGPLALRRAKEVAAVSKALGTTSEVVDIHDGELMPTLENRRTITRLIREWNADIVITNRPNDYHPDHRYTSILVQDSAYMVGVPFITPNVPQLRRNPVFLYSSDRFQRPNPFRADVAVGIDEVMQPTLDALLLMVSQIHEGGADGHPGIYPTDPAGKKKREDDVRTSLARRYEQAANMYRDALVKFYGAEKGKTIKYAQAFEVCEYGRQPSQQELKALFPF